MKQNLKYNKKSKKIYNKKRINKKNKTKKNNRLNKKLLTKKQKRKISSLKKKKNVKTRKQCGGANKSVPELTKIHLKLIKQAQGITNNDLGETVKTVEPKPITEPVKEEKKYPKKRESYYEYEIPQPYIKKKYDEDLKYISIDINNCNYELLEEEKTNQIDVLKLLYEGEEDFNNKESGYRNSSGKFKELNDKLIKKFQNTKLNTTNPNYAAAGSAEYEESISTIVIINTVNKDSIKILSKLGLNPFIVSFIGVYNENSYFYNYDNKKNLDSLFSKNITLTLKTKQCISLDIAYGIQYLHNNNIVHINLTTNNIYYLEKGNEYLCKIGNFKFARELIGEENKKYYELTTKEIDSLKQNKKDNNTFFPPECGIFDFSYDHKYYIESDIWFYGILVLNIFTSNSSMTGADGYEIPYLLKKKITAPQNNNKQIKILLSNIPKDLYDILNKILEQDHKKRSKLPVIINQLTKLKLNTESRNNTKLEENTELEENREIEYYNQYQSPSPLNMKWRTQTNNNNNNEELNLEKEVQDLINKLFTKKEYSNNNLNDLKENLNTLELNLNEINDLYKSENRANFINKSSFLKEIIFKNIKNIKNIKKKIKEYNKYLPDKNDLILTTINESDFINNYIIKLNKIINKYEVNKTIDVERIYLLIFSLHKTIRIEKTKKIPFVGVYKKIMDSICDKLLKQYEIKDLEIKLPAYYLYNNNYHDHIKEITKKIEEYKSYTKYISNFSDDKSCAKLDDLKALIETEKTIIHYQLKIISNKKLSPNNPVEIEKKDINLVKKIGSGNFGQVYKGILKLAKGLVVTQDEKASNQIYVAIKKILNKQMKHTLMQEAQLMSKLGIHPNIVSLIGVNIGENNNMMLLQFCEEGELLQFLREEGYSQNQSDKLCMCKHIANGMEYIASKKIVHRDLAARNILIYTDRICKVADFGLSREMSINEDNNYTYEEINQIGLPLRWTCPTVYNTLIFTEKTDIWSFGILMIEIYTNGEKPYHNLSNAEVLPYLKGGHRIPIPTGCPEEIYTIILSCWNLIDKLTFKDIKKQLNKIKIINVPPGYNSPLKQGRRNIEVEYKYFRPEQAIYPENYPRGPFLNSK